MRQRGKQVDHKKILNLVCSRFDIRYLENKGLLQQSQSNSFGCGLFFSSIENHSVF